MMGDEQTPEDNLAALRARIDQTVAESPLLAELAQGYFAAFAGVGFTESQALYLTACQLHSHPGSAP